MRLPWRKKKDYVNLEEAKAERELSERKLQEAEPLLHSLREIRRRNHIGEMITVIIEREVEKRQL
jgi:hypothetical protein